MAERRITRAMVVTDGVGTVPLTETIPAPLVAVAGHATIDRVLDRLAAHGVAEAAVTVQRHRNAIEAHLARRTAPPRVVTRHQPEPLGSGGVVRAALSGGFGRDFADAPFFVTGADSFWLDGTTPALDRLAGAWADATMDALLFVHRTVGAVGYAGPGELFVDPIGRARLRRGNQVAPYAFAGLQLVHPRLFAGAPAQGLEAPFAIETLWAQAEEAGRLFAVVHDGVWFQLGSRTAIDDAEEALEELGVWRRPARRPPAQGAPARND
jgi:MurNAc alpha-1-phosphate uridylyltransferase